MARNLFINGESMVYVRGPSGDADIGGSSLTQLGLAGDPIQVQLGLRHRDVIVDAWGPEIPMDVQTFLSDVIINMNLVHFERDILDACLRLSMGGVATVGLLGRAGRRLGAAVGGPGLAPFTAGNSYIGLIIDSPVAGKVWRFYSTYMTGTPVNFPLGTERSIVAVQFRAIHYTDDPWGGSLTHGGTDGTGSLNAKLWDHPATATW